MSLKIASAAVTTVMVLVTACAAPPPSKNSPAQVQVNFNFNPQDQPGSHKNVERGAISGVPQHVGFYYSVNPDCSSDGLGPVNTT